MAIGKTPSPPLPTKELDQEKAPLKFAEFWREPVICPVCKTDQWKLGPNLVHLSHLSDMGKQSIDTYTAVVVTCIKCGYMMLFNANILGLGNAF